MQQGCQTDGGSGLSDPGDEHTQRRRPRGLPAGRPRTTNHVVPLKARRETTCYTLSARTVGTMDSSPEYVHQRDLALVAIGRQKAAAAADRLARQERDAAVLAMLKMPGTSLGSVAADVGLST